ncbi:MAG TPA: MFS transporter [Caulobacteraceae bacterium]|jgi:PPP family 3-phenylpropionic acid transporter
MPTTLRLGLFYAALFIGTGASGPYAGVWFRAHGLSGAAIGLILALPQLGRALTGPALALWADGFKLRRTPIALICAGMGMGYVGLAAANGFWPWLGLWFVSQSLMANISPLADVIALRRARAEGFNYGWPRGIGSAAYVVGNIGMGVVLHFARPDALLVWITAGAAAVSLAAQTLLPAEQVHDAPLDRRARFAGLRLLLGDPVFLLAIGSSGLIQASHGFYYGFSVLAWEAQGVPSWMTGGLWGVGVVAEIGFLWFLEPWRRRIGPERLLVLGGIGAVTRWTCLALSPPLWLLIAIQTLHCLSFTATFLGSLQLMERLAPPSAASLAQTLNSVFTGGFLIGLSTMAAGRLFDAVGAHGYLAMSAIALVGLAGAAYLGPLQRARQSMAQPDAA